MNNIFLKSIIVLFFCCFAFANSNAQALNPASGMITSPSSRQYDRVHLDDLKPITLPYLREADVFYEKRLWREIDLKEKMNQPLYFPTVPQGGWQSLMVVLWEGMCKGDIVAYDFFDLLDPNLIEFTNPIFNPKDVIVKTETLSVEDPNSPSGFTRQTDTVPFDPRDVVRYRIVEDWIFDKQRSQMQVRILAICPIIIDYDQEGNQSGYRELFWLHYPSIRPLLAKNEIFNRNNYSSRLSYDEFFLMRKFSSYIVKESNVYDRDIKKYATGIDALLESDRIKRELRDFEGELWVY